MKNTRRILLVGLLVTLVVAVVVAQFASSSPDGLEHVATQQGFANSATNHATSGSPLAGYGNNLTDNGFVNTAIAGAAGVLITLALGYGIFWLAKKTKKTPPESAG
jgi:cobalt/nickel transport system permease protein